MGLWRPGLQAVSWGSGGFCGITATSVGPGWYLGSRGPRRPLGSASCASCMEVCVGPFGRWLPAAAPSLRLWLPSLSLSPLPPLPKCLPQKSTRKCRWKTLMLTATPSSRRTSHPHLSGCHRLLPSPTPSQSQDRPGPAGHLLCFSWAFRSTVPPAHLADEETEARAGKQLARGHSASWG